MDIENTTDIDREAYTDLVKLLRQKLPANKEVSVAVAANPNGWTKGWHGTYDYNELAKYSNYLMIMAYDESYNGSPEGPVASIGWVDRSIQYALKQGVSPEKIVLGVPFYGRYWKEGAPVSEGGAGISNSKVDEMLRKYGGTVKLDEQTKSPKATITIKSGDPATIIAGKTLTPGTYHIWYENNDSIREKLRLVHKYELKGTGSWSLGQESTSMWQYYKTWMSHDGVEVAPVNPTQPTEQTGVVSPVEESYTVKSGDTLWKIATQNNMTVNELKTLNNLTTDVVNIGQVLKLREDVPATPSNPSIPSTPTIPTPDATFQPKEQTKEQAKEQPKEQQKEVSTSSTTYTVKSGDSVWSIATKNKMTVSELKSLNNLKSDVIKTGQILKIAKVIPATISTPSPKPSSTVQPKAPTKTETKVVSTKATTYTVKSGDSLWSIATKNKLTVNELKSLNGLKSNTLKVGQVLKISKDNTTSSTPKVNTTNQQKAETKAVSTKPTTYKVKSGDSLWSIATKNKLTVNELKSLNGLKSNNLKVGQVLIVKKASSNTTTATTKVSTAKSYPILKVGSKGTAVTNMQTKLIKAGIYKGKATGTYNAATKSAVIAFQKKYKLAADGIAGPATLSKLDSVVK